MTYKNIKFEDSPVFRSLEKLALKKGLIAPEELKKEASVKEEVSYQPVANLNQNILKLCSGLRAQGFESYANELEVKFLALKKAENILDTAHPEGSVKLPDMEGDAIIEDCEEQKKKIEEIIKKTPKGKFGKDIVNLVKITLAQAASSPKEALENEIDSALNEALARWNKIDNVIKSEGNLFSGLGFVGRGTEYSRNSEYIKELLVSRPATLDNLKSLKKRIEGVLALIKPGASFYGGSLNPWGGVTEDVYSTISPNIAALNKFIEKAYQARVKVNAITSREIDGEPAPEAEDSGSREGTTVRNNTFLEMIAAEASKYITNLQGWKSEVKIKKDLTVQEKATAAKWLDDQAKEFKDLFVAFKEIPDTQKESSFPKFRARLEEMGAENVQFYQDWVQ